jgi:hypothetical protein
MFPAPYFEDIDFDGLPDLVVSPNLYARQIEYVTVRNSMWLYKNTGTAEQPVFTQTKRNFLQEDMIDVGDYSSPAFMDTDGDGDLDMFIGYYADESFRGGMYHFENIGSASDPHFKQRSVDYAGMSFLLIYNIKPQAVDMNGDGTTDLAFTATSLQDGRTYLYYVPNQSEAGFNPNFKAMVQTPVQIGQPENVFVTDVTGDGKLDLLVGKATGALQLLENTSFDGGFDSFTVKSGSYLGLGNSTSRQNPAVVIADLDADGVEDLVMGDQRGNLSFYGDYRNFDPGTAQPESGILYNNLTKEYTAANFGGRLRVAVANIFNSSKPAVVVGNTLGGVYVLRNDNGDLLPEYPLVAIGPNPLERGEDLKIRADRNTKIQIFSVIGQKMSEQVFVPANQTFPLSLRELAAGMYVARFTFPGRQTSIKFIIK